MQTFELLRKYRLFEQLFPQTEAMLAEEDQGFPHMLLVRALDNTDKRVAEGKPVMPGFLFAAVLWEPVRKLTQLRREEGIAPSHALQAASSDIIGKQAQRVSMPRRFTIMMREIWQLQPRFHHRNGTRPSRLLGHPRFRAAYDFLLLRGAVGEVEQELCDWWTEFEAGTEATRSEMIQRVEADGGTRPKRKRKRRRRKG